MKRIPLFLLGCILIFTSAAQHETSSSGIFLGMQKLRVLGSVLYIAAHPDDENTRLLTYFSKERLYRTGYLSLTRGDGGQNLIGDEQGIELGLIRTQELLAARRIDGAEQFFTRAYDFGYSKTAEETLGIWGHDRILSDIVWVIRRFRPDVIITRFPETGEGGHGHHTASAILAREAFEAAGNPARFPGQLRYVQPWKPVLIAWNHFSWNTAAPPPGALRIDAGGYNSILGKSYGEIAAESRSQHKSQGFGVPASRGESFEYFTITAGRKPSADLFEHVQTTWERVTGGREVSAMADQIVRSYDFRNPQGSVPALVALYRKLKQLPESHWREIKMKETADLIEACSGLWIDAFTREPYAVQGDSIRISITVNSRLFPGAELKRISIQHFDSIFSTALPVNTNLTVSKSILIAESTPLTQPYWLRQPMGEGIYTVTDPLLIGEAEDRSFGAEVEISMGGEHFVFKKPVQYRFTDPVQGELYQPLVVVPPVVVSPDEEVKLSVGSNRFAGEMMITSHIPGITARITGFRTASGQDAMAQYDPRPLDFTSSSQTRMLSYSIQGSADNVYSPQLAIFHEHRGEMMAMGKRLHAIRHSHIPAIFYFTDATVRNMRLDISTAGSRIGYIPGAGDRIPQALEKLGYEVVPLGARELARNGLQQFDAIITGVRAYNTNEWLNNYYDKLMDYVHSGGNLIVQYNTSSQLGPVRARIGPYPFNIVRNRITDENSPVRFTDPGHPVLNFPNKITERDFDGWVQERSIYHAAIPAEGYHTILGLRDPGENEDGGSLIIAPYGKGYFSYTGISFFRQLPAGVPGAYRLMANLIALNRQK